MDRSAVDRPLLFGQEDRTREGSAYLQPGAERPSFLAHQVVMAGIRTLEPVDKNPNQLWDHNRAVGVIRLPTRASRHDRPAGRSRDRESSGWPRTGARARPRSGT